MGQWEGNWGFSTDAHLEMLVTAVKRIQENHRSHLKKLNNRRKRGGKKWGGPPKGGKHFQEPILSVFHVDADVTNEQDLLSMCFDTVILLSDSVILLIILTLF